jgi:hypothetical protein
LWFKNTDELPAKLWRGHADQVQFVIPANAPRRKHSWGAGIQKINKLDPGIRRGDGVVSFLP